LVTTCPRWAPPCDVVLVCNVVPHAQHGLHGAVAVHGGGQPDLPVAFPPCFGGRDAQLPPRPGDPYYVFLLLWHPKDVSYDEFREVRRLLLERYCMVVKAIYPEAQDIVGIATEDRTITTRSEDIVYLDAREWS
jgi:hypothetical protein